MAGENNRTRRPNSGEGDEPPRAIREIRGIGKLMAKRVQNSGFLLGKMPSRGQYRECRSSVG